jgi:hypothetical protein
MNKKIEQIKAYHDIISYILHKEKLGCNEENELNKIKMYEMRGSLGVLCWLLEHSNRLDINIEIICNQLRIQECNLDDISPNVRKYLINTKPRLN